MKKVMTYSALGLVIAIGSLYAVSNVYAEELGFRGNVSEEVRQEHIAKRVAERSEAVVQAMEEERITERQAEILNAMEEVRVERGRGMFKTGKDLTVEEREAFRAQRREEAEGFMFESLNEKLGDDVTKEELEVLKQVSEEIGIMGNQHNRRGGNGGARGTGECIN